jgi:putative Mg2+ transporter-C (MgtC) family protein
VASVIFLLRSPEGANLTADGLEMVLRLLAALVARAMIGYERSYHGRPAGFRTHTLVCTASSLLMLVTVYEAHWVRAAADSVRLDPTRMAQGIMTGIGFLGAGVIIKEGLFVRGLTTAASIWITAAIGILAGIGFYFPLIVSVIITLGVLSLFRWIEARSPTQAYYHFDVRIVRTSAVSGDALRSLIERHGFSIANFSYGLDGKSQTRCYSMVLRATDRTSVSRLSETLEATETILEFQIAPTGN